jgi:hypothetical protein
MKCSHFEACGRCHEPVCVCVCPDDEPAPGEPLALPCIVCGKQLVNVHNRGTNQPIEGLCFHTAGHFGSTAFDRPQGGELQISVCDVCLRAKGRAGHVLRVVATSVPKVEVERWGCEK